MLAHGRFDVEPAADIEDLQKLSGQAEVLNVLAENLGLEGAAIAAEERNKGIVRGPDELGTKVETAESAVAGSKSIKARLKKMISFESKLAQGGIVGVYVARDVDFSGVYALQPAPREVAR